MELNNIEKQIKEQLNSREIQPSEMAWTKLDAMLTGQQKPKRSFLWIYFAASITGFLLVGTVYFRLNSNEFDNQINEVVLENSVHPEVNKDTSTIKKVQNLQNEVTEKKFGKRKNIANKTIAIREKTIVNNSLLSQNEKVGVSINNQKLNNQLVKSQFITVSVDALLAAVDNLLKKEKSSNPNLIVSVDANNLLSEVDGELELSFREKVINKVSKNFQTVKVALSNRNLE